VLFDIADRVPFIVPFIVPIIAGKGVDGDPPINSAKIVGANKYRTKRSIK
jgi:hypothetical protein